MTNGRNAKQATSMALWVLISDQCVRSATMEAQRKQSEMRPRKSTGKFYHARLFLLSLLVVPALMEQAHCQDPAPITPQQMVTFDANSGAVTACSLCNIYTYAAGTNTPLAVYTDSTLMTVNTNPAPTNSKGYVVNGNSPSTIVGIWIGTSCYKFVFKDAAAVTIWTQDNICDRGAILKALLAAGSGATLIGFTPTGGASIPVATALNSAFIYDQGFSSAATACGSNITVAVTKQSLWLAMATQTCAAPLWFPTGAGVSIQPASGKTVTFTLQSAGLFKICDISLGGGCIITGPNGVTYPQWYGARGDSVLYSSGTDDTLSIQAYFNGIPALPAGFGSSPKFSRAAFFPPGVYKLSAALVRPAGAWMSITAAAVPIGNSPQAYLWQTDPNSDIIDACTNPVDSISVTNMGFAGPVLGYTAGTGNGICLGKDFSANSYDSDISHNYFFEMPNSGIHCVSCEGFDIHDNVSELGAGFFDCPQATPATQCDNNRFHDNWLYGHRKYGIKLTHGSDNSIENNHGFLNGDGTNDGGFIVINTTPASGADPNMFNTTISGNDGHQNSYDIVLKTAVAALNQGITGSIIASNISMFNQESCIYMSAATKINMTGNQCQFSSLVANGTYPSFDIEGASDQVHITGNQAFLNGGLGGNYGLKVGSSATNISFGTNIFQGVTSPTSVAGTIVGSSLTGKFTPVLKFGGASTGITYDTNGTVGSWVLSGSLMIVNMTITLTSKGSATGAATITGLPAASSFITPGRFTGSIGFTSNMTGLAFPFPDVPAGLAFVNLYNGSSTGTTGLGDPNFANNSLITLTVTYFID